CSCTTPGGTRASSVGWAGLGMFVGVLLLVARRRRRVLSRGVVLGSLAAAAASSQGCACGNGNGDATGCGSDCNQPCGAASSIGLVGAYSSIATAADGTIWVAGYSDADVTNGLLYGDLVVGKYDTGKQQVAWTTV